MSEIDWKSIAVRVFRADGACFLLNDTERDALLAAHEETPAGPDDDAVRGGHALLSIMQDAAAPLVREGRRRG